MTLQKALEQQSVVETKAVNVSLYIFAARGHDTADHLSSKRACKRTLRLEWFYLISN